MRFDYYGAGIEDDNRAVVEQLSKLGHKLEPCHNLAKAYHYTDGFTVLNEQTGMACRVFLKDGQRPYAFASSDATDAFVDVVRDAWPDRHLVTRCDPCQDYYDADARKKLSRLMTRTAKARRMRLQKIFDPLDKTAGQTIYLGSPSSEFRMRTYDKGWEQFGKLQKLFGKQGMQLQTDVTLQAQEGIQVRPGDWIRTELQARPKDEQARRLLATATPEQAWGFTDWTHELAKEAFALDLERLFVRARKVSKDEEALRWMCRQYAGPLLRLAEDVGDCAVWDNLRQWIREQQSD